MIGTCLSHYRITAKIGEGGMGEVYRATDENLGRDVAIKVLPDAVAKDSERLARFKREAHLLASLNHTNIAAIHGLEEADGKPFLVLELVEGEDLSARLERGPIPGDEAIDVAKQIAEALEEAHEHGIVHRDLKPANVKLTPDGKVKVLDFGLAKAFMDDEASKSTSGNLTQSPTMTSAGTQAGLILGTAAYMSPEQARGKPVDKRADIWAFGVVLYEMLTGRRLFEGETVSDILAAVLKTEPDWSALPDTIPDAVRHLLHRCLERDPKRRLHSAADAAIEIEESLTGASFETGSTPQRPRFDRRPWIFVGLLAVTLLAMISRGFVLPESPGVSTHLNVALSANGELSNLFGANAVLSPDGRMIAYVGSRQGRTQLHVRRLNGLEESVLAGTDDARAPFFSPDGRWIGFAAPAGLMKIGVDGGAPVKICDLEGNFGRGATWGGDVIAFASGFESGLSRVPAGGGAPEPLTTLDLTRDERSHRWPSFLPGAKALLFMVQRAAQDYDDADIEAVSLADGRRTVLVRGGAFPRYAAPGSLLFVRDDVLFALRFDSDTLTVEEPPTPVLEGLLTWTGDQERGDGSAEYALSREGDRLYRPAQARAKNAGTRFVWVDPAGREEPAFDEEIRVTTLSISPDGKRVAFDGRSARGRGVFLRDLERGTTVPLTSEGAGESEPVWSPDGRRLAYAPRASGDERVVKIRTLDGAEPERTVRAISSGEARPKSWTRDGQALVVNGLGAETASDLWLLPLDGGEIRSIVMSPRGDVGGQVSPNGLWVAYFSEEKGVGQIFVTPLEQPGPRWQVSFEGASQPRWSHDGRLLYYASNASDQEQVGVIVAVAVEEAGDTPRFGEPRTVFRGFVQSAPDSPMYDVHPDGRLLIIKRESLDTEVDRSHAILVLGWRHDLDRRMAATR